MDTKKILSRVEELSAPILDNLGYRLIERELIQDSGRWVLRLYIDKEDGVKISDCALASRALEDLFEVEELIPVRYILEMSSPGINRPLRYRCDFEKFAENRIKLKTTEPIANRSNYTGTLKGLDGDSVIVIDDGVSYKIPMDLVAKARIEPEIVVPDPKIKKGMKKKGGKSASPSPCS